MKTGCMRLTLAAFALLALTASSVFAQNGLSSIAGTVADSSGGVLPGATITAKNDATAATATGVSTTNGAFTIPGVAVGTYTVTVTLQGFKTAVLKGVTVSAGTPASVKATLEVGGVEQTVEVQGAAEVIQTTSSAAATTLNTNQITSLPLQTRNTLDFVTMLPGVQTAGSNRSSTVNGLPQSSIAITLDGVSIQDNFLKSSDGFFARVSPRLDAVEEVTVTGAAQGADATGQGATQIQFTTKSGTNKFAGTLYDFYQSDRLNTNTFANKLKGLPKGKTTLYQPGGSFGGPITIPGVVNGHDRAFFFINLEQTRQPDTITTTSTLLNASAQNGVFTYGNGQTVNLYALAAAKGFTSTPDPLIGKLLSDIANSTTTVGGSFAQVSGNLNNQTFSYQQPVKGNTTFPTVKLDYNLTPQNHAAFSINRTDLVSIPDTTNSTQARFPGFPIAGEQDSGRYAIAASFRSTIGRSMVNTFHFGFTGGETDFSTTLNPAMWTGPLANQGGYSIGLGAGLTSPGISGSVSARNATTRVWEDTFNWQKASHSLSMGYSYTRVGAWLTSGTRVPSISLGTDSSDPAFGMFTTANFPGASNTDLTNAEGLYGLLTGRVTTVSGTARLDPASGQYVYNGNSRQDGRLPVHDFFVQDNWRAKPNLSINVGVRYAIQAPFIALNGSYSTATLSDIWGISGNLPGCDPSAPTAANCNLFKPGTTPGTTPAFINLGAQVKPYNTDLNNFAPSIGANWTPSERGGALGRMLGKQGDTSLSAGWSRAFERRDMNTFTSVFSANPGLTVSANRTVGNGNLTTPLLFRDGNLGGPPLCSVSPTTGCMLDSPVYPLVPTSTTGSVNIFDPNIQTPYSDTYTVGLQRALGRKSAIEVRYVGTRNRDQWTTYNMNESDILDNGFLQEFQNAQTNLQANIANGKGATFAYMGAGTGTVPLPIYLAYFSGFAQSQAGDASKYTSTSFTNASFVNPLAKFNPNPFTPAGTNSNSGLAGTPGRIANAIAAGLPRNYFMANPDATGGANVTGDGGYTTYNSLQTQYRRRLSGGLQFDASYVLEHGYQSSRFSFRVPRVLTRVTGQEGDVTQVVKSTFVYELPFGRGKRFGANAGSVMDRIVGGWKVSGTINVQTGRLFDLNNVRLVGMTEQDVQKMFTLRRDATNNQFYYAWPQDVIDQTINAFNTSATSATGYSGAAPTGRYFAPANSDPSCIETISGSYGTCGVRTLVVTGPLVKNVDLSFRKVATVKGHTTFEFDVDVFNVFNWVTFLPATGANNNAFGTTLTSYQAGLPTSDREAQLGFRVRW